MSAIMPAGAPLPHLRIEVGGNNSTRFKSLDHVIWDAIPPFAVLTGVNGSGKTQLLEFLAYRLTKTPHPQAGDLQSIPLAITGDEFEADAVAYVPSRWDIGGAPVLSIAQMQQAKKQLFQNLHRSRIGSDMSRWAMRARLERLLGVTNLDQVDQESFVKRLPDDFAFMLEEADITSGLTHVFLAYRLRRAETLEAGAKPEDIPAALGPAPWDVLNQTLSVAEFPYRVASPEGTKLLDEFQLFLEDQTSGARIRPMDLSSGEKVLLGLVLWLYNSQHHGRFPRLFLLDEPDAHLHPSMTRHMLNVIKEVLVDRYGVRTIMTTHSPSTVAMAPDASVFEMSRTAPRIVPSSSKAHSVGLLTAGLVTVSETSRYVLAEDSDDVTFFETIRDILTDYGPSRDKCALAPAPSVIFLPASSGQGKAKISGGCTVVQAWVDKFDQPPLDDFVRGVIDRDVSNAGTDRIQVLGRYSIENYLLDPLVVFGLLVETGSAPSVAGVSISQGDEHLLRTFNTTQLQAIVEVVRGLMEAAAAAASVTLATAATTVEFTSGVTLTYPSWVVNHRGHDLLPVAQNAYGGAGLINPPRLLKSLRRVRLIPKELALVLSAFQG